MWRSAPSFAALLFFAFIAAAQVVPSLNPFEPVPQGNASFLTDTQNWLTNETYLERNELQCDADIIVKGCLGTTAAGLTHTPTSCVAYAGGYRVTEIGNITYPDNSVCTVAVNDGITSTPANHWTRVGSTHYVINCLDPAPAPAPINSALLMQVTTSAGSIVTVVDLRHLVPSCTGGGGGASCSASCTTGSIVVSIGPGCSLNCLPNPCVPNPCPGSTQCVITGVGGFICICASTTTTTTTTLVPTTTTSTTTTTITTTTVTTTTTTTTTSTTTTTTLSPASVTFLDVPEPWMSYQDSFVNGDGTLFCNLWVAPIGINNATTFVFNGGNNTGNLGVAIYNAAGSTRISTTGGLVMSGTQTYTTTTGAFTLNAGTAYQICFCANRGGGGTVQFATATDGTSSGLTNIQQAFTTLMSTKGANACTSGSPPLTTGALTADVHEPIGVQLATDSP